MPAEVFDEVSAHVGRRVLSYGEKAEELKTKEDAAQLAKDLGKYLPALAPPAGEQGQPCNKWALDRGAGLSSSKWRRAPTRPIQILFVING